MNDAKVRDAFKAFLRHARVTKPVNPQFKLIDTMAANYGQWQYQIVTGQGNTGIRTGDDGMQRFWDESDDSF